MHTLLVTLLCLSWSLSGQSQSVNQVALSNATLVNGHRYEALVPDSPWHLARLAQKQRLSETAIMRDGGLEWNPPSITRLKTFDWEFPRDHSWGTDVFVYVLDTGVLGTHVEFLEGQVLEGAATGTGKQGDGMRDEQGHGTGVASLVVGQNVGVAKSAKIVPVKIAVDGSAGEVATTASDVAAGLEWACKDWEKRSKENARYRAVINISWITKDHPMTVHWLGKAISLGMHVVIAAGNGDSNECQDDLGKWDENKWIRPTLGQIGVGEVDYNDVFWHHHGPCVDLTAPSYYLKHADSQKNDAYAYEGRTSQAAPLVTGIIAALITLGQRGHNMSPKELRELILRDYTHAGIKELPQHTPDRIINSLKLSKVPQ